MTNSINSDVHNQRITLYNNPRLHNDISMQAIPTNSQEAKEQVKTAGEQAKKTAEKSFAGNMLSTMLNTEGLSFWQISSVAAMVTAACGGFVKVVNNLFRPSETSNLNAIENLKTSKISKAASKIDAFVQKVPPLRWLQSGFENSRHAIQKVKSYSPKFIQEILDSLSKGSIAPWDKNQLMTSGKGTEAMGRFIEFLEKVPKSEIAKYPQLQNALIELAEKKITTREAFSQIEKFVSTKNADFLRNLKVPENILQRLVPGRAPELELAFKKALDFNMSGTGGFFGKAFKKFTAYLADGIGGTFLGGKFGMIPHALFTSSAVFAGMKAEKGDGLKKGMEDFIGNMIFGYLAMFPVSFLFNKVLGLTELGLDKNKIQELAKKLGMAEKQGGYTLQECVIRHNELTAEFRKFRSLSLKYDRVNYFGKTLNWFANLFRKEKVDYMANRRSEIARKIASKLNIKNATQMSSDEIIKEANKHFNINSQSVDKKLIKEATCEFNKTKKALDAMWGAVKESKPMGGNELTLRSLKPGKGFFSNLGRYLLQKPLRTVARILSIGRYTSKKASGINITRSLKQFGGGLGRIIFVGGVLMMPFTELGMKFSHKIFGKPKKSALDEGNEDIQNNSTENLLGQPKPLDELLKPVQNNANPFVKAKQIQNNSSLSNNDSWKKLYHSFNTNILNEKVPAKADDSNINGDTNVKNDDTKDTYTYIPSSANLAGDVTSQGVQPEFSPMFQKVFRKADIAEANAMQYLPK